VPWQPTRPWVDFSRRFFNEVSSSVFADGLDFAESWGGGTKQKRHLAIAKLRDMEKKKRKKKKENVLPHLGSNQEPPD
jgi:hypothetical protein